MRGRFVPHYMGLEMLIILIIVGVVLFLILKYTTSLKKNNFEENSALKILDERLAKGEISEEEYKAKKELLKSK